MAAVPSDAGGHLLDWCQKQFEKQTFLDCTVACPQGHFKAHKLILSACSEVLAMLLEDNPCDHPTLILDTDLNGLLHLLNFVYYGITPAEHGAEFFSLAEKLVLYGNGKSTDAATPADVLQYDATTATVAPPRGRSRKPRLVLRDEHPDASSAVAEDVTAVAEGAAVSTGDGLEGVQNSGGVAAELEVHRDSPQSTSAVVDAGGALRVDMLVDSPGREDGDTMAELEALTSEQLGNQLLSDHQEHQLLSDHQEHQLLSDHQEHQLLSDHQEHQLLSDHHENQLYEQVSEASDALLSLHHGLDVHHLTSVDPSAIPSASTSSVTILPLQQPTASMLAPPIVDERHGVTQATPILLTLPQGAVSSARQVGDAITVRPGAAMIDHKPEGAGVSAVLTGLESAEERGASGLLVAQSEDPYITEEPLTDPSSVLVAEGRQQLRWQPLPGQDDNTAEFLHVDISRSSPSVGGTTDCVVAGGSGSVSLPAVQCNVCGRMCPSKQSLRVHMRTHTDERPFACAVTGCSSSFRQKAHLATHMQSHDTCRPHMCDICHSSFKSAVGLQRHREIHARLGDEFTQRCPRGADTSHDCSFCHKSFMTASSLEHHMRVHTNQRPFPCPVCGKHFKQKSHLTEHERIHSGLKPFKCHRCPQSFYNRTRFKLHQVQHINRMLSDDGRGELDMTDAESMFPTCTVCYKRFINASNLRQHQTRHSTARPFGCQLCECRFKLQRSLLKHVSLIHAPPASASQTTAVVVNDVHADIHPGATASPEQQTALQQCYSS